MKEKRTRLFDELILANWFPLALQLIMLVVFFTIICGAWRISTEDGAFAKTLRNTNLSNLLVWSYWWPLIIVSAILLGRVWCAICPIELISFWAGKVGLRRKVPAFFQSGWLMTGFYALIVLVGVHTLAIHRQPHRMAVYMLVLLVTALVCGLVFQKRAFCSYVCPVGHLLGLYSMFSWLKWHTADGEVCAACQTKDCVHADRHYRLRGRSCTSGLYPAAMHDQRDCLLCTQCAKACPHQNVTLSWRRPWEALSETVKLKSAQILFVVIVSGFVVYEILTEWPYSKTILTWIPQHATSLLHIPNPLDGLVSAVIMFVVYPAVLYLGVWLVARSVSRSRPKLVFVCLSLLLLPTMAAAHLIKACLKMTSRIPYWKHALTDPPGVVTAGHIVDKTVVLDKTLPNAVQPGLSALMILALIAALLTTVRMLGHSEPLKSLDRGTKSVVTTGALMYWALFMIMIIAWRW